MCKCRSSMRWGGPCQGGGLRLASLKSRAETRTRGGQQFPGSALPGTAIDKLGEGARILASAPGYRDLVLLGSLSVGHRAFRRGPSTLNGRRGPHPSGVPVFPTSVLGMSIAPPTSEEPQGPLGRQLWHMPEARSRQSSVSQTPQELSTPSTGDIRGGAPRVRQEAGSI